ncbi:hypothetical protein FGADI_6081 [Fusarium gaditjirri]|uniref:Uncharacterized protein n=1 Tax=Fusarium gaditjirri TaxID=282569 RepID=A0A8H4WX64_9HYPO|nr:hypothetical protein FGADI_6081 [Fusarium gaditjirri]
MTTGIMAPILGTFYLSLLFILLLFSQFLDAIDLSVKHPAQGQLKVRLDYGLATQPIPGLSESKRKENQHRYLFSSYLVFNEPVSSITDGQLRMIAQVAHGEMEKDMQQYKPAFFPKGSTKPSYLPSVMTIVAFGNEIILSSSQKGRDGFIDEWPQSPVKLALDRCSTLWRERVVNDPGNNADPAAWHKNQAKCGEVNAFHQYYMTHTTAIPEVDPKVRVTTVVKGSKGFSILPPCGTARNGEDEKEFWGCNLLVRDQDVHYIGQREKALPFALHKIAGGVQKKGQIQMCTRNHIIWEGE